MEFKVSNIVLEQTFAYGEQIGYRRCMEDYCMAPKYFPLNKIYKRFGKTTVLNWIKKKKLECVIFSGTTTEKDGEVRLKGKNITQYVEFNKCMQLELSEKIEVYKS